MSHAPIRPGLRGPGGSVVRLQGGALNGRLRVRRPNHEPEFVISLPPTFQGGKYVAVRYDAYSGRVIGYVRPSHQPERKVVIL